MTEIKEKPLKLNMVLNAFKGLMGIVFPLITFPYVSRILGVIEIGRYSFSMSVISYFVLLSNLGINNYAIREGARIRQNPKELNQLAKELFSINLLSAVASYVTLIICSSTISKFHDYTELLFIFSVQIITKVIGVEWLYSIYEDYIYITVRSIIFHIISLFLLFLLVKSKKDTSIYALITVFSISGADIINGIHARKYCIIRPTFRIAWKKHIIPIITLFAISVTAVIYVYSDTMILGFFCNDWTVGIYSVSTKIYTVVKSILSSIFIVTIPRFSALLGKNNHRAYQKTAQNMYGILLTILFPAMIGLILLRKPIILLIAGEEYLSASSSLFLLGISLLFCFGAYFWGQCILVPLKLEKIAFKITFLSAITNIFLNIILIPIWKENAAAFTTIIAEAMTFFFSRYEGSKHVDISGLSSLIAKSLLGCGVIVAINFVMAKLIVNILTYTICTIVLSIIGYFGVELLLKNDLVVDWENNILSIIKNKRFY